MSTLKMLITKKYDLQKKIFCKSVGTFTKDSLSQIVIICSEKGTSVDVSQTSFSPFHKGRLVSNGGRGGRSIARAALRAGQKHRLSVRSSAPRATERTHALPHSTTDEGRKRRGTSIGREGDKTRIFVPSPEDLRAETPANG